MDKVEVKVNVINQLKLLRQSTFKDKLSFLDEDVQNAQRAKATKVEISIDYSNKKLIIENNGKVLENPQALFSIAESEWDEDVQKSESPFGMGFFSNITVSDYIEVFSGYKHIIFDVGHMIQSGETDIKVNDIDDTYEGFKLVLNNFDFDQVSHYSIRERVELLGKYIHELDIYYNGILQPKKDLTEGDGSVFLCQIQNESLKGWIALNQGFGKDLKIFYKGRLVTKLDDFYYIKGDLHINDKTLNLTAPDRKDIVKDEKLIEFKKTVRSYIESLCLNSFLRGHQNYIDEHIDSITYYINKNELKKHIKFLVFKGENEDDINYLQGIALVKKNNSDIKTFNDYEVFIRSEAARQTDGNIKFLQASKTKPKPARGVKVVEDTYESGYYREGYVDKPEIKQNETVERDAEEIITESEPIFWIGFDEVVEQEKKFNIAKHYGLKIVVSRNKLESSILEMMGYEQDILHISQLSEETSLKAYISNTTLSIKEQRALMLLDMISRMVGYQENIFSIGDLMVTKETSIEVISKTYETIEETAVAVYNPESKRIYIDRSIIDQSKLVNNLEEKLCLEDYKFILMHLKDIVKELQLVDSKETEFKSTDKLYEGILTTLAIA